MFRRLQLRHDISELDILLIVLMSWWGVWMFVPWTKIDQVEIYQPMFDLAPRIIWATATVVIVLLKLTAIRCCLWRLRMATLILFTTWWAFIASMYYLIAPNTPGWGMVALVALVSLWRSIQIATMGDSYTDNCLR